jgi:hypothetical protein
MAKAKKQASLPTEARNRYRARFDAMGPWRASAEKDGLAIVWNRPTVLADAGFPFGLRLEIAADCGYYDPDELMLALWNLFLKHRQQVLKRLQRDAHPDGGPPDRAEVVITRSGPSPHHYEMLVRWRCDDDEESDWETYCPATDSFEFVP